MYKVTIQATRVGGFDWKVVASGTWNPGQPPELGEQEVPAEALQELFNLTPVAADKSGRNQITCGDTLYAVVFRKLAR